MEHSAHKKNKQGFGILQEGILGASFCRQRLHGKTTAAKMKGESILGQESVYLIMKIFKFSQFEETLLKIQMPIILYRHSSAGWNPPKFFLDASLRWHDVFCSEMRCSL